MPRRQRTAPKPASFSPAALVSHQTTGNHAEFFITVFPPVGKEFEISLPLIPRWFAYGPSGRSVYATALKETGPRSFTGEPGMFKIELDPVRANTIRGLDAFGSIGPFAVSRDEDLVVSGGSKGNGYPANSCGVYEIHLPTGDVHAAVETSDCRAGSPWRVLSRRPTGRRWHPIAPGSRAPGQSPRVRRPGSGAQGETPRRRAPAVTRSTASCYCRRSNSGAREA